MEQEEAGKGSSLSWRSRDNTSWWTSAVDLSSTLISKMDQVPASLVGFTVPWHPGGRAPAPGGEFAGLNKPVELPKPKNEAAQPLQGEKVEESAPNGAVDAEIVTRSFSGPRVGESRRRTKRMSLDLAPERPTQDAGAPIRSKHLSTVSQEFLLGNATSTTRMETTATTDSASIQRDSASIRRIDDASILSSRRRHSSRSLHHEPLENNPPHALPQPPGSDGIVRVAKPSLPETFPGNPNELAKLRVGNPNESSILRSNPVVGGSYRVPIPSVPSDSREASSLPTSPRFSGSKESRASKLLRMFKLSGTSSRVSHAIDPKSGKRSGAKEGVNNLIVSQQERFVKSLEPRRQGITSGVSAPTIHSECIASVRDRDSGAAVEGKKSGGRWLFKWRWGTKPAAVQSGAASPTAEIMSDARDAFYTSKSDRYSSARGGNAEHKGHRRGSSWGCASFASTAVIAPFHSSRRKYYRIQQEENGDESFRSHGSSFRSTGGGQSLGFEDCHGSFRGLASGGSCASFRSVEEIEWDSRLPPPLPADQTLTIGDVAALCNSSLKFVFKCREVQHFNKFLRSQKSRLLSNTTECFNVILSGTDIEVSSMVAAMAYAWFLENTVPKVTGETWHAVPVIDMPRHQMHKHKSAAWLFDACGIDPAALLFADEMELGSLVAAGRLKTSVIGQDVLVTRNEVGSVCTLLGEKLGAEAQCLLEPRYMKTLLLAGVLLDTENLDFASMRDTEMTTTLLVGSGSLGRNGFFDQLREVEDDDRVSKFIIRNYGDGKQLSGRKASSTALKSKIQQEAEQEQSDKDSLFTQSQDHTSTSEAGTNSSLDEDSPRLKQRSSFKYTKLPPQSAPARNHHLPSPANAGCNEDGKAVAHIRKAATQFVSSKLPGGGNRSPTFTKIRKRLFLYQA